MDDPAVVFNVVVVEDDPLTRLAVELVFVDDGRFRVCWHAGSLSRALERAAEETREIDLVVLDDVLDGRAGGAELAPLLKHLWPAARVVLFSADPDARNAAPDLDAAVPKTEPERLLTTSRALLGVPAPVPGRRAPTRPAPIRRVVAATGAGRARGARSVRPPAFASGLRLAAAAAAVLALVAAIGAPAPARLVAEAVGFVGRLVPGAPDRPDGGARPAPMGADAPAGTHPGEPVPGAGDPAAPPAAPAHIGAAPDDAPPPRSREGGAPVGDEARRGPEAPAPSGGARPPASPAGRPPTAPAPPGPADARPQPPAPATGGAPDRPPAPARPAPPERGGPAATTTTTTTTAGAVPAPAADGGEAPGRGAPGGARGGGSARAPQPGPAVP